MRLSVAAAAAVLVTAPATAAGDEIGAHGTAGPVETELDAATVLARVRTATATVTSLRAELRQIRRFPAFDLTDPAEEGTIRLQRAAPAARLRIRIDLVRPVPRTLLVEGDRYVYYQPDLAQAFLGPIASVPDGSGLLAVLAGGRIDDAGAATIVDPGDGDSPIHLRLQPPPPQTATTAAAAAAAPLPAVDLWIEPRTWLVVGSRVVEDDGSVITVQLDRLEIDPELEPGAFRLELPRGVERVRQ